MLIPGLRMLVACSALLGAAAQAQMSGYPMSQPVPGAYPMSQPAPSAYPMSQPMPGGYSSSPPMPGGYPMHPGVSSPIPPGLSPPMSPPMSSPMGVDPGYGTNPGYGANPGYGPAYGPGMGQGEGQRKRAAFLGPLLMQLMPMIVNPMVQSFVDSRRAAGAPAPEVRSLTEAYAMAPPTHPGSGMPGPMISPPSPSTTGSPAGFEAGLAYEVFLIQPDGSEVRISPAERTHRRGDRFYVRFMTNLPGQVMAFNVDPVGRRTAVGEWSVEGGFPQRLPARGHFRFDGDEAGRELLEFQFTPCRNASASSGRQRAIRVVEEAETALRACTEALSSASGARRMRAIVAVEDDKTAFATAPAAALGADISGLSVTLEFRRE